MNHDIRFEAAFRWDLQEKYPKRDSIKNAAVLSVFDQFDRNLYRVWSFATLLPMMVSQEERYARASERVWMQTPETERKDPGYAKKSQEKIHAIVKSEEDALDADQARDSAEDERIMKFIRFILGQYEQSDMTGRKHELFNGLDLLFQTILINAWSAFEILAEGLWIAAIDNDASHKFAGSYCKEGDKQSKSFTYKELKDTGFHFNFSRKMGSLLSKTGKVKFDSFSGIARNYEKAFELAPCCRLFQEVLNLDKADAANVLVLESVRNQLMHRGQSVDSRFMEQVQKAKGCSLPSITGLAENDTISLDGEMVKSLLESVISLGVNLTRLVDEAIPPTDEPGV
jgi:hypothetical protein